MDTGQLPADCPDQQRGNNRAVYAAGESEQYLLISDLLSDEFNLILNEVLHVPVCFGFAGIKHKRAQHFGDFIFGRPSVKLFTSGRLMSDGQERVSGIIDIGRDIDWRAVHNMIRTSVQNNAFDIRQLLQLADRNIMGVDFTVHAESADCSCNYGVLGASQIQNYYHVLFHGRSSFLTIII